MKNLHAFAFALLLAVPLAAQPTANQAPANPPAALQRVILSHDNNLIGIFYTAAGAEPHPTAVLLHGYPGFEQNLDLAQTLRAHGWNVLAMHYRGSWGVKGTFSFAHAAEDADAEVRYVLDPATVSKYHIDTHRVVVIGHSMGGFMAASALAHNPAVAAAVLISAWNIGADYESGIHGSARTIEAEAKWLESDGNILPLAGTSGLALAHEIHDHQSALNMNNLAPAIGKRPVFVLTASEGLAPSDHAFVEALQKAGDPHVTEQHWDTDHSYSDRRTELSTAILNWLQQNLPQ